LFETLAHVPRWRHYYLAHDQTSSYQYLATQLKALQFLRGGRRWLLKSPQRLEQLPVLDAVFPEAIVVCTHREPMPVTLSMIAMLTYTARMHRYPVPVHEIAAPWVDRLELMLAALVRDRDVIPPERSIDVRFDDFMAGELGIAERVYHLAGEPLTEEARAAMADYLAGHHRGRLGHIATSVEMFGLESTSCTRASPPVSSGSWREARLVVELRHCSSFVRDPRRLSYAGAPGSSPGCAGSGGGGGNSLSTGSTGRGAGAGGSGATASMGSGPGGGGSEATASTRTEPGGGASANPSGATGRNMWWVKPDW
jgi:hypothetical protein